MSLPGHQLSSSYFGEGDAVGETLAAGEGGGVACLAELVTTVGVGTGSGRLTGAGPLFRSRKARGTMIRPPKTVTTKVTAPHSRRISWPKFTVPDSSGRWPATG